MNSDIRPVWTIPLSPTASGICWLSAGSRDQSCHQKILREIEMVGRIAPYGVPE